MAEDNGREHEDLRAKKSGLPTNSIPGQALDTRSADLGTMLPYTGALLADTQRGGRGNASMRTSVMHRAQRTHGNSAVQRAVQRMAAPAIAEEETDDELARRIEQKAGSGSPLDAAVRSQVEGGLGSDLSGVRIHTDAEADRLARSVQSVAFTSGNDIFFSAGAYNPSSAEGLRLIAHEATHTVQQSQGAVEGTPSAGGVSISDPSDQFEQAAEKAAEAVISGGSAKSSPTAAPVPAQRKLEEVSTLSVSRMAVQRSVMDWLGPAAGAAAMPFLGPLAPVAGLASSPAVRDYVSSIWGLEPPKPGESPRGYAYGKADREMGNIEGGFSALSGSGEIGGVPASVDYLYGSGKSGLWKNEDTGGTRFGTTLSAGVNKWNIGKCTPFSFDAGVGTASAELSAGTDGFSAGLQANIVEGAATMGKFDGNRKNDEQLRLGLSAGAGAAARLHWGDSDGDGKREYGFGGDYAFFSGDIKTEDPLRTAIKGGLLSNPFTAPLGAAAHFGLDYFAPDTNLTDTAVDYGTRAYNTAADYGGRAYDSVSSTASDIYDSISSLDPSYLLM